MKEKIAVVTMICVFALSGCKQNATSTVMPSGENSGTENATLIGESKAKEIALAHAEIGNAEFSKAELDMENGKQIYEIEFYSGSVEYEYDIDALTGEIIHFEDEQK